MDVTAVVHLAQERLEDAKENHTINRPRVCVGRAYYCFFHCVQALLASKNIFVISHSGSINKFNELFIRTSLIDKKYSIWLGKLFEERMDADYDAESNFDDQTQQTAIEHAEKFLLLVKEYLVSKNLLHLD